MEHQNTPRRSEASSGERNAASPLQLNLTRRETSTTYDIRSADDCIDPRFLALPPRDYSTTDRYMQDDTGDHELPSVCVPSNNALSPIRKQHQVNAWLHPGTNENSYRPLHYGSTAPSSAGSVSWSSISRQGTPGSITSSSAASSAVSTTSTVRNSPGPFKCTECGKVVDKRHMFNKHMLCHTRPHKCNIADCKSGFAQKKDLRRHKTTVHSACMKAVIPTGQYLCPFPPCKCAYKGCTRKDNLDRHMKNKHNYSEGLAVSYGTAHQYPGV